MSLHSIGQRFGLAESTISRICSERKLSRGEGKIERLLLFLFANSETSPKNLPAVNNRDFQNRPGEARRAGQLHDVDEFRG